MLKPCFVFLILLFGILAAPTRSLSFLPPNTPIVEALAQGSHAFIGRLKSVEYFEKEKGAERAEGVFEILLPIYGTAPNKGETTRVIYYTASELDDCLDFNKISVGTASIFIFKGKQHLAPKSYAFSFCWPRIDLAYEITNPIEDLASEESVLDTRLISGWWAGKISVKKLLSYRGVKMNQ